MMLLPLLLVGFLFASSITATKTIAATTLFQDSFTDTDNTPIASHNSNYSLVNEDRSVYILNNKLLGSDPDTQVIYNVNFPQDICMSLTHQFPLTIPMYLWFRINESSFVGAYVEFDPPYHGTSHFVGVNNGQVFYLNDFFTDLDSISSGDHIFKLCGQGATLSLYLDNTLLSSMDVDATYQHGGSIRFSTSSAAPVDDLLVTGETVAPTVEALSDSHLWIGLKNSDDQGTRFDLRTEVYINEMRVSDGITRCITGVTRNPNQAKEVAVPFGPITDGMIESGDSLSLKVLTRIGTNPDDSKCPGHNNAVGLRLYYDSVSRPARFGAQIAPDPLTDFFLHPNALLDDSTPTATTTQFKDSASVNFAGGNPWKEIGTWIMILP